MYSSSTLRWKKHTCTNTQRLISEILRLKSLCTAHAFLWLVLLTSAQICWHWAIQDSHKLKTYHSQGKCDSFLYKVRDQQKLNTSQNPHKLHCKINILINILERSIKVILELNWILQLLYIVIVQSKMGGWLNGELYGELCWWTWASVRCTLNF